MNIDSISKFFHTLKRRPEIQALIPMGYNPGIPALSVRAGNLCIEVPYVRYKVTGEKDRTLVYPIRFVATYLVPEFTMISFCDLAYTPEGEDTDYDVAVGHFRHHAIASLSHSDYEQLREATLSSISHLSMKLLGEDPGTPRLEPELRHQLQTIVEPSLYPFYKSIAPEFFNKYISHGKD